MFCKGADKFGVWLGLESLEKLYILGRFPLLISPIVLSIFCCDELYNSLCSYLISLKKTIISSWRTEELG